MTSGTLVDRVAALTVTIQNSPVHNMAALDSLVAMATKKGRREAMMAVGEWFLSFHRQFSSRFKKVTTLSEQEILSLLVWFSMLSVFFKPML